MITPLKKESLFVVWVEINTSDGNFIIQKDHAPTTFSLSPHKELIYCLTTGKTHTVYTAPYSMIQVTTGGVVLITRSLS